VLEAVESWLPEELEGADAVHARIAKRLAAQLDDPGTPAYVVARVAGALVDVVAAIERDDEVDNGRLDARTDLRRLLRDVLR
jgi:hypothetical protein